MISCELAGGLGNYMFQIAAGYTLAKKNDDEFSVDFDLAVQIHKNINNYKENILRKVKNEKSNVKYYYQENNFTYEKLPYVKNLLLKGYFQSEKYLDRELILDLYSIDSKSYEHITNYYLPLLDKNTSVSLHVRRGDYLDKVDRHPPTELSYCENAMNHYGSNYNFLVMSDDIEWCKKNITGDNVVFIEGEYDYIDLWLMSLCQHNIITNSSFSWWGSWLNQNKNKSVIAPKVWFGPNKNLDSRDIYCKDWILI
tara:strand:- start:47 stop:808 length:762 start_codon:yes stop_codon:yes gene_type:complete